MIKQVTFFMRLALGQEGWKWSIKEGVKANKGMTKISTVFNGKYVWNLGDRLERDLAERTTTEATQKYCLITYSKILIRARSPVCKTHRFLFQKSLWDGDQLNRMWWTVNSCVLGLCLSMLISRVCYFKRDVVLQWEKFWDAQLYVKGYMVINMT